MISIRNVTKRFGAQLVLDDVSLEIEPGKMTAIVGPSGVGKSVLLKLIIGILQPEAGEILVFGKDITKANTEAARNAIRANLGVLFQSAALLDSLTVYDNVAFALQQRATAKMSRYEVHDRVMQMLESLSLERYVWCLPQEISLGMRKRVGMARALITEPKILLVDEPNTGLDPLVGQEVYDLINACRAKWGFTGVVISHEIPEVFQVSDKVLMLFNGKVMAEGSPEDLNKNDNAYVKQFFTGSTDGPIRIQ